MSSQFTMDLIRFEDYLWLKVHILDDIIPIIVFKIIYLYEATFNEIDDSIYRICHKEFDRINDACLHKSIFSAEIRRNHCFHYIKIKYYITVIFNRAFSTYLYVNSIESLNNLKQLINSIKKYDDIDINVDYGFYNY